MDKDRRLVPKREYDFFFILQSQAQKDKAILRKNYVMLFLLHLFVFCIFSYRTSHSIWNALSIFSNVFFSSKNKKGRSTEVKFALDILYVVLHLTRPSLDYHVGKCKYWRWQVIFKVLNSPNNCSFLSAKKWTKIKDRDYTTVCPGWIWLTLFAYYGVANYILTLLKVAFCIIFPYNLIFEKNFWFRDGWFFTLKS